jgi:adenosylhomocysteine nucleosidase
MEGAAVAQVAEQEGIPWLVLRVISDGADASAAQSFRNFIKTYDRRAWSLLQALLSRVEQAPER